MEGQGWLREVGTVAPLVYPQKDTREVTAMRTYSVSHAKALNSVDARKGCSRQILCCCCVSKSLATVCLSLSLSQLGLMRKRGILAKQ